MTSRRIFLSKLNPFSGLSRCETEPAEKIADLVISRRTWLAGILSAAALAALPGCASFAEQKLQLYTPEPEKRKIFKKIGNLTIIYEGDDLKELAEIDNCEEKIQSIYQGIVSVEDSFGRNLTQKVIIKPLKQCNAMATNGVVVFSLCELRSSFPEAIKVVSEHECLHIFIEKVGFHESEKLQKIYEDISEKNYERREGTAFFGFINEDNFMRSAEYNCWLGGHSKQNIKEFITSFLHSLMYIERLEKNLNRQFDVLVHKKTELGFSGSRENIKLSNKQKLIFLNHYIRIIEAMIAELNTPDNSQAKEFLREKLEYVKKVKEKMT